MLISCSLIVAELVIFRSPKKQIYRNLDFQPSWEKFEPKHRTKYLGAIFDEHLSFNEHINTLKQKLNRANGIAHTCLLP